MIVRAEHSDNFTTMSNTHLQDKELSLKAKGLLSWMLTLPDSWDFSVAGIASCIKESKDTVRSTLQELEKFGYLERSDQLRAGSGIFGASEFTVYEEPQNNRTGKSNAVKSPKNKESNRTGKSNADTNRVDFTDAVNPTQINTNITNTKESKKERKGKVEAEAKRNKSKTKRKSYDELVASLVDNSQVQEKLLEYIGWRCTRDGYLTNAQVKALVKRLNDISQSPQAQIEVVDQALRGSYKDFAPLRERKPTRGRKKKEEPVEDPVKHEPATDEDGNPIVF